MAGQSDADIKAEEEYREYLCKEVYENKECGFTVLGKSEDEVIEHARMHQEEAHGMRGSTPEMEDRIKENIRSVPMVETKEYTCTEPGCKFSVRANTEDEIIEQAHMHQDLSHSVKESMPETHSRVMGNIRTIKVPAAES
ncbi:MAG: DUF1059 domain-containing protein [Methanotrichaceae archaeon]